MLAVAGGNLTHFKTMDMSGELKEVTITGTKPSYDNNLFFDFNFMPYSGPTDYTPYKPTDTYTAPMDYSVPTVPEMPVSDYVMTCPTNFSFASVTNHDLWQEGVMTGIYCNLAVINSWTGQTSYAKTVRLPPVHFGVAYHNVEGAIVYTPNNAKEISADALNFAESDMRKKYKSDPSMSTEDLARYWLGRIDHYMKEFTHNRSSATRNGAQNPTTTPPSRAYDPC